MQVLVVYMQDQIFVISLAADVLSPQGTMSSVGTMMTTSFYTLHQFDKQSKILINTSWPRQNGHLFADDTFKCISLNENVWISFEISLKFVP